MALTCTFISMDEVIPVDKPPCEGTFIALLQPSRSPIPLRQFWRRRAGRQFQQTVTGDAFGI